jgi:hypothetical protein
MLSMTLRSLSNATATLAQNLRAVRDSADEALLALAEGHAVRGTALGHGPLGAQVPFDIAMNTARVTALIDQALLLGATGDQITAAYKAGV